MSPVELGRQAADVFARSEALFQDSDADITAVIAGYAQSAALSGLSQVVAARQEALRKLLDH